MGRRIWNDRLTKNAAYPSSLILCCLKAHPETRFDLGLTGCGDVRGVLFFSSQLEEMWLLLQRKKRNFVQYLTKTTHYRVKRRELLLRWMSLHSTFYSKCTNWWTLLVNTEWTEVAHAEDTKCRNKVLLFLVTEVRVLRK